MTRYTCTLADGTALSVECADASTAHDTIAQYTGIQRTHGVYVLYMRMHLAGDWTRREISLAKRMAPKS
jgi:hypothetical protein